MPPAAVTHGARLLFVELEPIRSPGANPTTGIGEGRFRSQAGARNQGNKSRDGDSRCVAIIKATGLAKFKHQVGKDGIVIAKGFHQQPDKNAADCAD
jgi:hypothetical protein